MESEGEEVNSLIKNIYKCMDNFKSGELAIIQQIGAVVPFIQNTLQEKVPILFILSIGKHFCQSVSYLLRVN